MTRHRIEMLLVTATVCLLVCCSFSTAVVAQDSTIEAEPNDSRENATSIEFGGVPGAEGLGVVDQQLTHTVEDGSVTEEDVDFFKFDASAGEAINVYVRAAPRTST